MADARMAVVKSDVFSPSVPAQDEIESKKLSKEKKARNKRSMKTNALKHVLHEQVYTETVDRRKEKEGQRAKEHVDGNKHEMRMRVYLLARECE